MSPLSAHQPTQRPVVEKRLSPHSPWILKGDQRGKKISSLCGVVWITQASDPEDHLLNAGETFVVTRRGPIVVEGISETVLRVAITN